MKKLGYALFSMLALSGCVTHSPLPKTVHIPVPVSCPRPQIPTKPALPLDTLNAEDKPDVVMKAYVASIKILAGYNQELIHILQSYNNNEDK